MCIDPTEVIKVITGVFLTDPWLSSASFWGDVEVWGGNLGIAFEIILGWNGEMFEFGYFNTPLVIFDNFLITWA